MMRHKAKVRLASTNAKGRFECPVKQGYISSGYGPRWESFHHGIDLAANLGVPIVAAEDGVVKFAKSNGGYGNLLTIQHMGGYTTRYGHCDKLLKKVGQRVHSGEVIATVGNTGHSTGPHLHFEVRHNGKAVDPFDYIGIFSAVEARIRQRRQRGDVMLCSCTVESGASTSSPRHKGAAAARRHRGNLIGRFPEALGDPR
eukprot:6936915-Pyramimonas_sp.AAC.1